MPISNKSSEKHMTATSIRINPTENQRQPVNAKTSTSKTTVDKKPTLLRKPVKLDEPMATNEYPILDSARFTPETQVNRTGPRMIRVQRVPQEPQVIVTPLPPQQTGVTKKSNIVKDLTSRGTTPPPISFIEPLNQRSYYSNRDQPLRSPPRPATIVQYDNRSSPIVHSKATTSETTIVDPKTTASTTTKTSTRILDSSTMPGLHEDSFIEETTTTTTIIKPVEVPQTSAVVASTTTTTVPPVGANTTTTTIRERPIVRTRRRRLRRRSLSTISVSTFSTTSSSSTSYTSSSSFSPPPHIIRKQTILPPRPPIETTIINDFPTEIVPERRYIRQVRRVRTYSGYYSSDLDHGKRKVYKSDYKYRHFYYCNWFRGRCDLPNSSCSYCEWFYGCPLWALILVGLFLLALIVTFFTLFGLQPTINSARRDETAETRLINRTEIIYGYLQNCGFDTSGTVTTTLVLCANTGTTSTSRVALASSYTTLKGRSHFSTNPILISFALMSLYVFLKTSQEKSFLFWCFV